MLAVLAAGMQGASNRVEGVGAILVLSVVALALTLGVVLLAQDTLNRYWERVKGEALSEAPIDVGEVLLVLLGVWFWAGVF